MEGNNMAKVGIHDIASLLAEKHGLSQNSAELFIDHFIDVINNGLTNDKLVKIKGFGSFKIIEVKNRESINVNTGERIVIEGRGKINFTPDSVMKELVNKPFSLFETTVLNDGVVFDDFQESPDSQPQALGIVDSTSINEQEAIDTILKEDNDETIAITEDQKDSVPEDAIEETGHPEDSETIVTQTGIVQEEPVLEHVEESAESEKTTNNNIIAKESAANLINLDNAQETDNTEDNTVSVEEENSAAENEEGSDDAEDGDENDNKEKTNNNDKENEETTMEEKSNFWSKLLSYLIVALLALGIGYYIGVKKSKVYIPMGQAEVINGELIDSTQTDSLKKLDSIQTAREARIKAKVDSLTQVREARNESIKAAKDNPNEVKLAAPSEKKDANNTQPKQNASAAKDKVQPAQTKTEKPILPKQDDGTTALKAAKQMVNTGAYSIVGTQETITVKAGQSMKSISKFYFGDGMECYLQTYNGISEVKEGMKLRIPKLQMKKKK